MERPSRGMAQISVLSFRHRCTRGCGRMATRVVRAYLVVYREKKSKRNLLCANLCQKREERKRTISHVGEGCPKKKKRKQLLLSQLRRKSWLWWIVLLKSRIESKINILKPSTNHLPIALMHRRYLCREAMGVRRCPPPLSSRSAPKRQ